MVTSALRENGELFVVLQPGARGPDADLELRFYRHDRRGWTPPVALHVLPNVRQSQLACALDETTRLHVFAAGLSPVYLVVDRQGAIITQSALRLAEPATVSIAASTAGDIAVALRETGTDHLLERPVGGGWFHRRLPGGMTPLGAEWFSPPPSDAQIRGPHLLTTSTGRVRYVGPAGTRDLGEIADYAALHVDAEDRPQVLIARRGRLEAHVARDGAWTCDSIDLPRSEPADPSSQ